MSSEKQTFIQLCLKGAVGLSEIDSYISRWHLGDDDRSLDEYLGMTPEEYALWVEKPESLKDIVFLSRYEIFRFEKVKSLTEMAAHIVATEASQVFMSSEEVSASLGKIFEALKHIHNVETKPVPKKVAVKLAAGRKPSRLKAKKLTATAVVLKVIRSHKKGIDIPKLQKRTGFADSKIRAIVYRASREGKIKRLDRGVYGAV